MYSNIIGFEIPQNADYMACPELDIRSLVSGCSKLDFRFVDVSNIDLQIEK